MNKSPKRQSISAHSLWDTLNADKMVGEFKHKKKRHTYNETWRL